MRTGEGLYPLRAVQISAEPKVHPAPLAAGKAYGNCPEPVAKLSVKRHTEGQRLIEPAVPKPFSRVHHRHGQHIINKINLK